MKLKTAVQVAHTLAAEVLKEGEIAVDATAGNGHDTVFLAHQVGEAGHVFAFDLQKQALKNTETRLKEAGFCERVTLIHASHHLAESYIKKEEKLTLALFNLGYLPGGDKSIVTKVETTLRAAEFFLRVLKPNGRVILVLYPGHEEGRLEAAEVETWASRLPQSQFTVQKTATLNQINHPPYVITIEKRG
ncbi:MAG TPA: class I SAM-dependent methyltransferase [Sporolactobacillaceae bacterium]|nr:class I SAM-dependent methyltransferase [Sporolactobacillaceae bacterium]